MPPAKISRYNVHGRLCFDSDVLPIPSWSGRISELTGIFTTLIDISYMCIRDYMGMVPYTNTIFKSVNILFLDHCLFHDTCYYFTWSELLMAHKIYS